MKKLQSLFLLGLLLVPVCSAAPVYTVLPDFGVITLDAFFDGSSVLQAVNVAGNALIAVSGPDGAVGLLDPLQPFPNLFLAATNVPGLTESLALVLDIANFSAIPGGIAVPVFGIPVTSISDAALATFVGASTRFNFAFQTSQLTDTGSVSRYVLTGIDSVPEPASAATFAAGILLLAVLRRRGARSIS